MRLSSLIIPLFGGLAAAASCPYASMTRGDDTPSNIVPRGTPVAGKKGVMLMNRIAPAISELYVSNADGSNARLLLGNASTFDYHAQWSPDGEWIVFTSERAGDGQSDLYRVRPDGTDLQPISTTPAVEDAGVISPNGSLVAFAGTLNNYKSNIWIKNLDTGSLWNVTNSSEVAGDYTLPDGHFRPAWSPDGEWVVFTSDRNTPWRGHNNISGWEHVQELSIYAIHPNGSDFHLVANRTGYCLGSPKFSPDGSRIVFYEIPTELTYYARVAEPAFYEVSTAIVSVDFATGTNRIEHASAESGGIKLFPQYIDDNTVGYLVKSLLTNTTYPGSINYTAAQVQGTVSPKYRNASLVGYHRSPAWSPDGSQMVYEHVKWDPVRPVNKELYSWDDEWEYRFSDVFPQMSQQGKVAYTSQQTKNSSLVTMNADGTGTGDIFDGSRFPARVNSSNTNGTFQASWRGDGEVLAVGLGDWFEYRYTNPGWVYLVAANGSWAVPLTNGSTNAGFPTISPDGRWVVWREFAYTASEEVAPLGLRRMDLTTGEVVALSSAWDNTPMFAPDGSNRIVFTRRTSWPISGPLDDNYDVMTMAVDGSDVRQLTTLQCNDAHAVWTHEGKIAWASGMYGFQDEAAIYDNNQQPYPMIMQMEADGSNMTVLTQSRWEDTMPLYIPNDLLVS
ncbi:tricorn protease N-terminal domain-containing protein [Aspergillus sclerotioniger CBS 115572]|uniref:Tricorn protease N-terminal domain-containing protein n=1 Tax=Aspergillus sclerotioniger CBS 115572 TaxID=1450535 RepID=A0A317XGL7_9EURO|nr:tricorn protease N-terminal domain-containing protein [Aspergillus sclerotioniger CBS 115572]PWY96080.1 tricorn protease N-terminal domain-containing protein [Aspergillus sclerotioniger CBS 115572]